MFVHGGVNMCVGSGRHDSHMTAYTHLFGTRAVYGHARGGCVQDDDIRVEDTLT